MLTKKKLERRYRASLRDFKKYMADRGHDFFDVISGPTNDDEASAWEAGYLRALEDVLNKS